MTLETVGLTLLKVTWSTFLVSQFFQQWPSRNSTSNNASSSPRILPSIALVLKTALFSFSEFLTCFVFARSI